MNIDLDHCNSHSDPHLMDEAQNPGRNGRLTAGLKYRYRSCTGVV